MSETPIQHSDKEWRDGYNIGYKDAHETLLKRIEELEEQLKAKPVHFTSDHVTVKMAAPSDVRIAEDALAREYQRGLKDQEAFDNARIEELKYQLEQNGSRTYWYGRIAEFEKRAEGLIAAKQRIEELEAELKRAERNRKTQQDVQTDIVFSLDAHDPEGARPSGRTLSDTVEALLEIKDQTIKRLESTLKGLEQNYDKRYEDAARGMRCRRDHIRLEHELQETKKHLAEAKKERDEYKDVLRRVGDKHAKELQERSAEARKGFNSLGEINTKLYAENQRLERELGEAKDELTILAEMNRSLGDGRTELLRQIQETKKSLTTYKRRNAELNDALDEACSALEDSKMDQTMAENDICTLMDKQQRHQNLIAELKQRVQELEAALFKEKTQHKEDLDALSAVRADLQCRLIAANKDLKEARKNGGCPDSSGTHELERRIKSLEGLLLKARGDLYDARTRNADLSSKTAQAREEAYELGVRAGMRAHVIVPGELVSSAEDIERFRQERGI